MFKYILILTSLFYSSSLFAQCDPQTIEFYLDKGFNQEQITKLCSQSSSAKPTYEPYQKPIVIYQEGTSRPGLSTEEQRAIKELEGSIDGRSIDVTDEHINYITSVCLRAGKSPSLDDRVESCTDVAFSLAREGLRTKESGAGLLFFGQVSVEVESSQVIRKFVTSDPWGAYSADLSFLLQRKYDSLHKGNTTKLPLRKGATTGQVVSALRTLAAATETRRSGETRSEVSQVLDDNYVPPTEEEYIAATPTYEEQKEEEKKKKKWWNPFD